MFPGTNTTRRNRYILGQERTRPCWKIIRIRLNENPCKQVSGLAKHSLQKFDSCNAPVSVGNDGKNESLHDYSDDAVKTKLFGTPHNKQGVSKKRGREEMSSSFSSTSTSSEDEAAAGKKTTSKPKTSVKPLAKKQKPSTSPAGLFIFVFLCRLLLLTWWYVVILEVLQVFR